MKTKPKGRANPVRRVIIVVATGIGFYVALPALVRVIGSWPRLFSLEPWWLLVALLAEVASFFCAMALLRLVLGVKSWFAVITAGLAGNAVTNVLPSGGVAGASVQYRMLVTAGVSVGRAAGGLATTGVLGLAGLLVLPVFALPVLLGGVGVSAGLEHAAELGIAGFVLISIFGVLLLTTDRPLVVVGRSSQWLLHKVVRRRRATTTDLSARLLQQRDLVRADLGRNWWRAVLLVAGRIGLDYLSLLAALRATGARPNPSLVLLAYAATAVISLVPITPGGLGIVEASLSGLLVLAGVASSAAVVATLAFRLGSYWLPTTGGGISYLLFRHRYGTMGASVPPA
jgi:uncharacterized protein (TIRG00374 family)